MIGRRSFQDVSPVARGSTHMDKVVHFEIPYEDGDRVRKFYSEIFGWELNPMPEMRYTIVHTVPVDEKQMPKESGAINGGMMERSDSAPYPVLVIKVSSIDECVNKVEGRGGNVVAPKISIGDMGYYARVKDSEGNIIGLWEDKA